MNADVKYPELLEKTFSGDPQDYKNLAYKYYDEDKNSLLAFEWFHRAAQDGDAEAQYMVGSMFFFGNAKERNFNLAVQWLLLAYKQSYARSLLILGWIYEDGFDLSPYDFDLKSAEACFSVAWNQYGLDVAKENLDRIHKKNRDNKNDLMIADPKKHLNGLVGLDSVKQQLSRIEKRILFSQRRMAAGIEGGESTAHHFVFSGNSGSGKTEVARVIGAMFKQIGVLHSGHVVEVERSELVAGKVGQTAMKTKEVIEKALDGVLFIDEAHMLWDGYRGDFGLEAISTLVKFMEDYRDRLVVIFAGYPEGMKILLNTNPGLKSRIRHHLDFEDYTAEELSEIYFKFANDESFILDRGAVEAMDKLMKKARKLEDKELGNGRFVRNAFDTTIEKMAIRVMQQDLNDKENLETITFIDIPSLEELKNDKKKTQKSGEVISLF